MAVAKRAAMPHVGHLAGGGGEGEGGGLEGKGEGAEKGEGVDKTRRRRGSGDGKCGRLFSGKQGGRKSGATIAVCARHSDTAHCSALHSRIQAGRCYPGERGVGFDRPNRPPPPPRKISP